jgi:hypothetical protein
MRQPRRYSFAINVLKDCTSVVLVNRQSVALAFYGIAQSLHAASIRRHHASGVLAHTYFGGKANQLNVSERRWFVLAASAVAWHPLNLRFDVGDDLSPFGHNSRFSDAHLPSGSIGTSRSTLR